MHKPECAKSKDPNAACSLNCEAPTTRYCNDCGAEIGASEKTCPKCKADLAVADAEDDVVQKSLKRIAARNKREKKPPVPPAAKPKSPLLGLGKLIK